MKKYKINVIKRYSFTLDGENKKKINDKVDSILNESQILDLPYVRKDVRIKIRDLRKDKNNERKLIKV